MKVSLITPSFNRADLIRETADSIFKQTYQDWEWVIVDDGSTDDSWSIIEEFARKDSRVKIFKRDRLPKGAGTCRNIAILNCIGIYILFLDTDDLLSTFCLDQRVRAMQENPSCDFIVFPMLVFKERIDDTRILWNIENGMDDINRLLYLDPLCGGTGTLWKRETFIDIGMWNEELVMWQDIELHIRALLNDVIFSKKMDLQPDIFVRMDDKSISRSNYHSLAKLNSRIEVLSKSLALVSDKRKLVLYNEGFRNLAKGIFIGATDNNTSKELIPFWNIVGKYSLFSKSEINTLKRYTIFKRFKLYRIPFFSQFMLRKFNAIAPSPEKTLIKVRYNKEISV